MQAVLLKKAGSKLPLRSNVYGAFYTEGKAMYVAPEGDIFLGEE